METGKTNLPNHKRLLTVLLLVLLAFTFTSRASAHPADVITHNYILTLNEEGLEISWGILPAPLVTEIIWGQVDTDGDSLVSSGEAVSWAEEQANSLTATLDGESLSFELDKIIWPDSMDLLRLGDQPILLFVQAAWPEEIAPGEAATLVFSNQVPNSLHWFSIEAEGATAFSPPTQEGGRLDLKIATPLAESSDAEWLTAWESGKPSIPGLVSAFGLDELAEQASESNQRQGVIGILEGLIRDNETSPVFYLSAFGLSLILGALHAMSPGHGKTVVAAYLVGASGRYYHAVALGSIVTLTHTGSVFALGIATLAASSYFMPTNVFPLLEIISGLLILILGISLLTPRIRDWLRKRRLDQEISAPRTTTPTENDPSQKRVLINQPITEIGPDHSHIPEERGYIPVPRGPSEGSPLQGITWRSLLTLGISGGLVPCPDAIAILLIAVTINRISFGLSLIVAFSLGLAVILILIGLLIVQGRRLFERLRWFDRAAFVMPIVSALIVLGLGAALTLSAFRNLPPDVLASLERPARWNKASVIYGSMDENFRYQLYTVSIQDQEPTQITDNPQGIASYSVSPDGSEVIYAASTNQGGTILWRWLPETDEHSLMLDCSPDHCSAPVWPPEGEQLIYERLPDPGNPDALGFTSIWWLDMSSGETGPVFQDSSLPGFSPRWSAEGEWLSYGTVSPNQVRFYHLGTGESIEFPLDSNPQVVWHPTENAVLYTEYLDFGEVSLTKLFRYDLESGQSEQVSDSLRLDETLPSWSPDGGKIAVVRREWEDETAGLGDQIWLLDVLSGEESQLTFGPEIIHGEMRWSPDGEALLFHIYDLNASGTPTSIQLLDLETGEVVTLATPGTDPHWLP